MLFLDGSASSLDATMDVLEQCSKVSGLSINLEKTKIFKIGQLRNNQDALATRHNINWSQGPIETLVIKIPISKRSSIFQINYEPQINNIEDNFLRWQNRKLSLRGKTTIIKTYGTSKITYLASMLPNPPDSIKTKISSLIFKFLWGGKKDKIKRDVMINTQVNGGLSIPDIDIICTSQKIAWVKRYIEHDTGTSQWGKLVNYTYDPQVENWYFRVI